jgi:hypothetical protein
MISYFLIISSPGKFQLKMKKKVEFWLAGERMLLRAGDKAVPRASPTGSSHLGKTPLPAYCRHDAK